MITLKSRKIKRIVIWNGQIDVFRLFVKKTTKKGRIILVDETDIDSKICCIDPFEGFNAKSLRQLHYHLSGYYELITDQEHFLEDLSHMIKIYNKHKKSGMFEKSVK